MWRDLRAIGETDFRAYQELTSEATVLGLVVDGEAVDEIEPGTRGQVVLDRTPFYAESGGQIADEGVITADGVQLKVLDVQRPVKGLIAHTVEVVTGPLRSGAAVLAEVDPEWRLSACQAHSGTHVVHAALRQVLGPSALQSGSYNKPGYLRLDFAWGQALSAATRSELEEVANLAVRKDLPVSATYMPLPQAREIGALALFGETYDEDVRVVEIGGPWSRELCGGTHVQHSSQIGALTVTGESSVGSGVRRVEAFVGIDALRYLARERAIVAELTGLVGCASRRARRAGRRDGHPAQGRRARARAGAPRAGAGGGRQPHRAGPRRQRRDLPRSRRRARRVPTTCAPWCSTCGAGSAPSGRASWRSPARPRAARSSSWRPTSWRGRAASGPASSCGWRRRRSAAVAAARTTSPRAVARTRRRSATPSRPSSGASGSSPADAGRPRERGVRLGVDVGSVRVGVAPSDPDGILATPVATVARTAEGEPAAGDADVEQIAALVLEHEAVGVVVGSATFALG